MFVIDISLGTIGKMDAASPWLLTEALADGLAIRHTIWHSQWTEAAIFIASLIGVATVKLEEILWSLGDTICSEVINMPHKLGNNNLRNKFVGFCVCVCVCVLANMHATPNMTIF